ATANHNILPSGYKHPISYEWSGPHRFLRIQERLSAAKKVTIEDCQSIQHDVTSLPAQSLIQIVSRAKLPPELAAYRKWLTDWDGVVSREAAAGPLYAVWLQELQSAFFENRLPKDARSERGDLRSVGLMLDQLLNPSEAIWGSDSQAKRDEFVERTF